MKGNCTGAIASAFDALKDWRDPVHLVIEWGIFTAKEYREVLWGWFTKLNAFLTIGPPVVRTRELAALIDAVFSQSFPHRWKSKQRPVSLS